MVPKRLTEAELESSLTEVLERVLHGERFAIERKGTVFGEIIPVSEKASITLRDLAEDLALLPPLDDDFGADVRMALSHR